ncbi:hypothetical protein M422DRAFT_274886 [Sphaerobolus stellatus SS14]|uniref:O-methyltransferase domain-containing protein n=1 Tax=Sphaerobolus stellatus (strain SS14) TaxID=990650 RepID=A0A0C9TR45_SPHS4|nr:hypothetical protein M422DRAFT_274886 [Sphaerobolus stellatus SS14]
MDERLDSLLAHITSAVNVIKSEYAKKGHSIPSLDSPDIRPFDLEEPNTTLSDAMKTVDAACEELVATVVNPYRRMVDHAYDVVKRGCICTVIDAKVPTHLKDAGEKGLPVDALSEKTGITPAKLSRVLRYLATKHIFREVEPDVFANNRYSMLLHEDTPVSAGISWFNEECGQASTRLSEVLRHPVYGPSDDPWACSLGRVFEVPEGKSFYWVIQGNEYREKRFADAMLGVTEHVAGSYASVYPWASLPSNTTIIDVGGGIGQACVKLYKSFPNLRFVIQDLPGPVEKGQKFWSQHYPEALDSGRVSFESFDFFQGPPISGAEIYYLRLISHNWKDADFVKILSNVRRAMGKHSKLLIHDHVLPEKTLQPAAGGTIQGVDPVLMNKFGFSIDVLMLIFSNARERRLQDFIDVGKRSGLKFNELYRTGRADIVEFTLEN